MKTVDALLDSLGNDAPVQQIVMGAFWTEVILDTDPPRGGLASTTRASDHDGGFPVRDAGRLMERSGRELAALLKSSSTLEASIGMAAVNALLEIDEKVLTETNAEEVILERGSGRRVAIAGHFPFTPRVRKAAAECWVLELSPRPGDLPAEQAAEILPRADVVALTGTSLINHTFDGLVDLCRPDAFVLLLGPSTPISPVLFEAGVSAISGTRVDDPAQVLRTVTQGATFRQVKRGGGLRLLTWIR
jgi:uncharacterized protein (DUF4213/DUF364 family)